MMTSSTSRPGCAGGRDQLLLVGRAVGLRLLLSASGSARLRRAPPAVPRPLRLGGLLLLSRLGSSAAFAGSSASSSGGSVTSASASSTATPSASTASGVLLREDEVVLDPPAALGNAGALADPAAQVVELRPADVAAGGDLELLDLRRVQRKRPLDPDPERLLADGEGLAHAAALALDHDALEDLGPPAGSLDHLEVHAHAVAGGEPRPLLAAARCSMLR